MFKKNKLIFLTALVFFSALLILSLNKNYFYPKNNQIINTTNQEISLEFSFDKNEVLRLKYPYQKDISVLNFSEQIAKQQGWEFKSQDYGEMGFLITQIKNKANGDENNYWHYYVNNELVMIAADKYILQANDSLSWRFEKSEF